jgi:DNA-binding IscR family transcriptional regulator
VADCLRRAGLLTITEAGALIPGRDISGIRLFEIFAALRAAPSSVRLPDGQAEPRVESLLDELEASARNTLDDRTLRDLLIEETGSPSADRPPETVDRTAPRLADGSS